MNTENKYFRELTLNLQREGFSSGPEANGLLPVTLDGERLCLVTESGSIRYRTEAVSGEARRAALDKVIDIAGVTAEYMRQMETAPFLKADGLEGDYRALAEFNSVVLAGHQTRFGVEFVTWEWVQNHTALWHGHYYGDSYTAAKQDFAIRSGLVLSERVFSDKQLAVIFDAAQHMEALGLSSSPEQSRLLEEIMEQIESAVPQVIELANELTQQLAPGGMTFC